jgi:beta-lactamase class A
MANKKQILFLSAALVLGFFIGFFFKNFWLKNSPARLQSSSQLRLGGYRFINPLLVCDVSPDKESPQLQTFSDKIQQIVDSEKQQGTITDASIYFRDLKTNAQININGDEKFFPASLNKIPLMIAFYKMDQDDPSVFNKQITLPQTDYNASQEIKPADFAQPGGTYTVRNLIQLMIKYSDNNSFEALNGNVDPNILNSTYQDLGIPLPASWNQATDFMTAFDFSSFLRVLYNATYLRRSFSEGALDLLSQSDFKDGLVAGVPQGTVVSHKYGLENFTDNGSLVTEKELHDCGIIYHPQGPYVLCIMTKSPPANLSETEKFIQSVSGLAYQEVSNNFQ